MDNTPDEDARAALQRYLQTLPPDKALEIIQQIVDPALNTDPDPVRAPSTLRPRRSDVVTLRVRIDLEDAQPPIWRTLDIRSDLTLDRLHDVLQAAFDWEDCHLHRFGIGDSVFVDGAEVFLCPFDIEDGDTSGVPEQEVRVDEILVDPGDSLRYCYDYGDCWDHVLVLEQVAEASEDQPAARCIGGERSAPPEDSGGIVDVEQIAEVLPDPARFVLHEINAALSDPLLQIDRSSLHPVIARLQPFLRIPEAGDLLASLVQVRALPHSCAEQRAASLAPIQTYLDHVRDELELTSAGYLKPADVMALAAITPTMDSWHGKANRENQAHPMLVLRDTLRKLGLLRKHNGRLVLTRAGLAAQRDQAVLWKHLRDRLLPDDAEFGTYATALVMLTVAGGKNQIPDLDRAAELLGIHGWRTDQGMPDRWDARTGALPALTILMNITTRRDAKRAERDVLSPVAIDLVRDVLMPG